MININGHQFTEEQFMQMQEEQAQRQYQREQEWRNSIKCGYAILQQVGVAVCGLTHTQINPYTDCPNCASFNDHVYEIISVVDAE